MSTISQLDDLSADQLLAEIKRLATLTRQNTQQGIVPDRDDQERFAEAMSIARKRNLKEAAEKAVAAVSQEPATQWEHREKAKDGKGGTSIGRF